MIEWITIWIVLWGFFMGLPNYLFKKYKINYHEYSWQHSLFYIFSIFIVCAVYKDFFALYFVDIKSVLTFFVLFFAIWILIPRLFKKDYYNSKKERLLYQIPKFFEILFQQFCFLGGLLTFGFAPAIFGLVFFFLHIPVLLFIPKSFSLVFISGSLVGGIIFASAQSFGSYGFIISLLIHLVFYLSFHALLTSGRLPNISPHRR